MKIEWASDFHADGTPRRRPSPSTMHGWLAKMRGTLSGNEQLRSEGMREMRHAKARKADPNKRRKKGQSFLAWLGTVFGRKPSARRTRRKKSTLSRKSTLTRSVPHRSSTRSSKPSRSSQKPSRSSGSRRHHHSSRRN